MRVVMWLVPLLLVPQEDADKQRRIQQALAWFADKDAELSQSARAQLVALGKDAVPAIEKKLSEKGVLPLVGVLREIDRNAPSPEQYALPADEGLVKVDKDAADKYLRAKYSEAMGYAKKNQFQKGLDMASGLLALEPRHALGDRMKQLRRYCENMITQTSLIEAKILQEKLAFVAGEPVALTMRLKNIFKSAVTIRYEGAEGKQPEGMAVIEIEARLHRLDGESTTATRHQEFPFEGEIPLATGAQWERKLALDTAFGLPDELDVQTVTVNAWTQPSKIDTDGVNITRKLQFEPAVLKLVPKRYSHFLEDPLGWLSKTIETGQPAQETWICVQVLPAEDRRKGAEILVRAMEKTENPKYVPALERMLTELTGERFGADVRKWSDWLAKQGQDKKKK